MSITENYDKRLHPIRADGSYAKPIDTAQVITGHTVLLGMPKKNAPIESQLLYGERVDIYEKYEKFTWVRNRTDGYIGYVASNALDKIAAPPKHRVSALRTFLYPKPDLKTQPLDLISLTSTVHINEEKNGFGKTPHGWVWSAHLSPIDQYETNLTAVACAFLGTPYLWGGRTSIGLDCSALVQLALASCGLNLPRDTDLQENALPEVKDWSGNEKDLMPGDLIYWSGHVALSLGQGRLIHANATHMAVTAGIFEEVVSRIRNETGGTITSIRRSPHSPENN